MSSARKEALGALHLGYSVINKIPQEGAIPKKFATIDRIRKDIVKDNRILSPSDFLTPLRDYEKSTRLANRSQTPTSKFFLKAPVLM